MVESVSIKGAIASMLNAGLGAGKKPPPLPTRSLASHLDDKTVVVDCESLTAAVPSVALDLGREIAGDASYLKLSFIVAHFAARVGDRIFSRIANAIDRNIVIGGELHIFLLANSSGNGKYIGQPIIADATGLGGNPARDASRF
jgi:hypothetical protein